MARVTSTSSSASGATGPPKSIRFLHINIQVAKGGTSDDSTMGEWHARKGEIRYDPDSSEEVLRETMLHEVLHAVLEHTSIEPEEHELIIRGISPLILHVLCENPKFTRWLVGD